MRCSTCLIEMRPRRGGQVCPKCGASGSALLDDGTEAEFESPNERARGWPVGLSLMAMVLLGAAVWAWGFRGGPVFDVLRPPSSSMISAPAAAPHWRMARLEDFAGDLRAGVIGVFGTDGEDRLLAFTPLASGELVAVLAHPETDGAEARASLVRLDGRPELRAAPLPAPGGLTGAALAPAGLSGFYLAVTGPGGVRLAAYGEGPAVLWERTIGRALPPQRPAAVLAREDAVYLIGPAEAAGRLGVAAYDTSGAQLWQRTFEAPEEGRFFAHLTEDAGLFVAFESRRLGEEPEAGLLWLGAAGETLQAASGLRLGGRLAGARAETGSVVLLEEGARVSLVRLSLAGERVSEQGVPSALRHDRLALITGDGSWGVRATYPLSDIQTDLVEIIFGQTGGEPRLTTWRLPAHTGVDLLSSVSGSSSLVAGTLGKGRVADAFVLVLPRAQAPQAEEAPLVSSPQPKAARMPEPQAVPAEQAPARVEPEELSERRSEGRAMERVCRFICQAGQTLFPLTKTLGETDDRSAEALGRTHAEACRQLGSAAAEAAPDCS